MIYKFFRGVTPSRRKLKKYFAIFSKQINMCKLPSPYMYTHPQKEEKSQKSSEMAPKKQCESFHRQCKTEQVGIHHWPPWASPQFLIVVVSSFRLLASPSELLKSEHQMSHSERFLSCFLNKSCIQVSSYAFSPYSTFLS